MKKDFKVYDNTDAMREEKKGKILRICIILSMAVMNLLYLYFAYDNRDIARLIIFNLTIYGIYLTNKK